MLPFLAPARCSSLLSMLGVLLLWVGVASAQSPVEIELAITDIPQDGLIFKQISLGSARAAFEKTKPSQYKVSFRSGARTFEAQVVPNPFFGRDNYNAMLLLQAPGHQNLEGKLNFELEQKTPAKTTLSEPFVVATSAAQWEFAPSKGVFPSAVKMIGSEKIYRNYSWGDRVYDSALGSFSLTNDKTGTLNLLSSGSAATVLRTRAEYSQPGKQAPGKPAAIYDWYFFKQSPAVFVDAYQTADDAYSWSQSIFLEWIFKEKYFQNQVGSEDKTPIELTGGKKSSTSQKWRALVSDSDAVALIGDQATVHDGLGSYGNYLRAANPSPTLGWNGKKRRLTGWLWASSINGLENLPAELEQAAAKTTSRFVNTDIQVVERVASGTAPATSSPAAQIARWEQALLRREYGQSNMQRPATWRLTHSGELGIALDVHQEGVRLISLYDLQNAKELSADEALPIFEVSFSDRSQKKDIVLDAQRGWKNVSFEQNDGGFQIIFSGSDAQNNALQVTLAAKSSASDSAWEWALEVDNAQSSWSVQNALFPQINLRRLSGDTKSFIPLQSGVVVNEPFLKKLHYDRIYPTGGCTMQFMAVYPGGENASGLYVARHDRLAARKNLLLDTNAIELTTRLAFSQTAENPATSGNGFRATGSGVWKLLRGDWFDAAQYYKQWAQREASWWPKLSDEGRADTPRWYRDLNVWNSRGGDVDAAVGVLQRMQKFLDLPLADHWYYWHQIPFDNDYPHYFPAVPGFSDAVKTLQQDNVHVMPYINGRLWDTRDKGAEDFEYTSQALPWTTKVTDGDKLKPFTSTFRSKESDGSPVTLAVMCPYTTFWQNKVQQIVTRLINEEGVDGVYLDQIGASAPILCMDPTHGHPLGGGHWWVEGYSRMLSEIQKSIPDHAILTTEDNAEPYMKNLDGVLTWQWINDGQVAAFPVVYGGAVQMFGRSFSAIENEDPNFPARMKIGQQLTFGEQIGWISPDFFFGRLDDKTRDYFKQIAHARNRIKAYITAGEMRRAPQLQGDNPTITANWKVGGPVTVNSVLTGAWKKHGANKLALVFTNVGEETRQLDYHFSPADYGVPASGFVITRWNGVNPEKRETLRLAESTAKISLPGLSTQVWEISWD